MNGPGVVSRQPGGLLAQPTSPGPRVAVARPDYSQAPQVVFWEVTRACALKCLHCRAQAQPRRHPDELTTEEGCRLLEALASFDPAPIVILTGGDPFLRRDLFQLLSYAMGLGLRVSLSPSATKLVTREALHQLRTLGISRLSLSLDGSTAAIHDAFRGVPGSFQRTQECIADALDVGLGLQVNTTVSRYNREDLPAIAQRLATFPKMALWDLFFLVPTGRAQRADVISAEAHEEVYGWLYSLRPELPFQIKTTLGQSYRRVVLQRDLKAGNDLQESRAAVVRTATNDGKGVCFISHLGTVYPSGFLPVPCGDVRRQSITDVYRHSPVFQALRDPERLKGKCGHCPFRDVCGGCRARAYAYTGDYLEAEPCCIFEPSPPSLGL